MAEGDGTDGNLASGHRHDTKSVHSDPGLFSRLKKTNSDRTTYICLFLDTDTISSSKI